MYTHDKVLLIKLSQEVQLWLSLHDHKHVDKKRAEVVNQSTSLYTNWASPIAQTVKNLHALWETWVRSLGLEDPLEKGMATHSSILAWRIPWTEEPGGLQSMGSQRVGLD